MALNAFHDAISLLLKGQVEKRSVLEGLDMVLLAADETIDDGSVCLSNGTACFHYTLTSHPCFLPTCSVILETDGAAIASRVSRPRTDTTEIVINEQSIMNACKSSRQTLMTSKGAAR